MASAVLMLVVLWERSPALSVALIGPLLAIALYQRSTHREMRALRLALTDPLTGLGNHRHFHERLHRELLVAQDARTPVSLCLLDVDDFKRVNDRFGHPMGDRVLAEIAARLRRGGEAFRLGGDEFAVLLPRQDEDAAREAATAIVDRIRSLPVAEGVYVTISCGVATLVADALEREELIRLADSALYAAKEHGKDQVRTEGDNVVDLGELRHLAIGGERGARYRAAVRLAEAVDARDAFVGAHSQRVGELAARVAPGSAPMRSRSSWHGSREASTTSASSPSRRRSSGRRRRSRHLSAGSSSATRRPASECSRASAWTASPPPSSITTNAGTAPAIPTASKARRSRSLRGSSSWPMRSTR